MDNRDLCNSAGAVSGAADGVETRMNGKERSSAPKGAIVSMLTLSTAHITEETAEKMEVVGFECLAVYVKGEYGFFIPVPDLSMLHEDSCFHDELPEDLFACLKFAASQDCCWLMLDNDCEMASGLPVYDW